LDRGTASIQSLVYATEQGRRATTDVSPLAFLNSGNEPCEQDERDNEEQGEQDEEQGEQDEEQGERDEEQGEQEGRDQHMPPRTKMHAREMHACEMPTRCTPVRCMHACA
jgi:hypothetical protein